MFFSLLVNRVVSRIEGFYYFEMGQWKLIVKKQYKSYTLITIDRVNFSYLLISPLFSKSYDHLSGFLAVSISFSQ